MTTMTADVDYDGEGGALYDGGEFRVTRLGDPGQIPVALRTARATVRRRGNAVLLPAVRAGDDHA